MSLTKLTGLVGLLAGLVAAQTTTLQAESAKLSGVTVATAVPGYTGSGYVDGFDQSSDKITFTVPATSSDLYDVKIVYNGPNGDKLTNVVLNGASGSQVSLPATKTWTTVSAGQVLLKAGSNTIEIQNGWGWYLIDSILLSPSAKRVAKSVNTTPVTPNANADAKALLKYLGSIYGKNILSGQQDQSKLDWVTANVGKTPAVLGLDLMDYTESRIAHGASSTDVDQAIAFSKKGGIITFVWHWNAPADLFNSAAEPWYSGFYTAASSFDIEAALKDTTNPNYALIIKDIDTIAVQLKKLQDNGVPVLFRPLHEAEGGWFWWGAKGPEPCKQLYSIMFDRLTKVHGLENLIWVWNSVAKDWYPGDDFVDIVSADTYEQGDHGPISAKYNDLLALTGGNKMIAAAEVGGIMEPSEMKMYQAYWSWFVVWGGDYVSGGVWNPLDFLKRMYNDAYVLTLDEIQGWRQT